MESITIKVQFNPENDKEKLSRKIIPFSSYKGIPITVHLKEKTQAQKDFIIKLELN